MAGDAGGITRLASGGSTAALLVSVPRRWSPRRWPLHAGRAVAEDPPTTTRFLGHPWLTDPPAFAVSQLFTWFFAPFLAAENLSVLTPPVFGTRGLAYAAWTLTAFCLGAFLGMLIRRILPAMAATLGVYAALAAATWLYLRDHDPVSTFWPMQAFEAGWLLVLSLLLIAGTVRLVRHHAT